jgi:hypothetical protein
LPLDRWSERPGRKICVQYIAICEKYFRRIAHIEKSSKSYFKRWPVRRDRFLFARIEKFARNDSAVSLKAPEVGRETGKRSDSAGSAAVTR